MEKYGQYAAMRSFLKINIKSMSIGSLINLSVYVNRCDRFLLDHIGKTYSNVEFNFAKKVMYIIFHIRHEDFVQYKFEINFNSIKYILIEPIYDANDLTNYNVYFELNSPPFLYFFDKEKSNFKMKHSRRNKAAKQSKQKWKRCIHFNNPFSNKFIHLMNDQPKIDPNLLGMALTYNIEIYKEDLKILMYLCYICKDVNRNVSFYIGQIDTFKKPFYPNLDEISKMIDDWFPTDYSINYACRVLFYRSYKVISNLNFIYLLIFGLFVFLADN